ncbi:amidohydrolase family protein [Granulicella cerasi]|uniref:Amidohydrolase family protein n=1 Tax=Granulicella cerasi TaxID=741063 RepID=A0ABW1Z9Y7_9BACT|nr:amidohydrolase family protein [Granulicella cerasi]
MSQVASQVRQSISLLILNADVVCFDDADRVERRGAIAVDGNTIIWIGSAEEAATLYTAEQTIDASSMIAMPGFIDCHVHTAQQFLHGKLPSVRRKGELRAPMWQRYLIPFESGLEPEDVYASGLAAYSAMISSGTTCFLEAGGPFPDEMGRAANDIGIRGRIAMATVDVEDDIPPQSRMTTAEALRRSEELVLRWKEHPRVNAWLSLRQLMVNTEELRFGIRDLSHALDTPIHTHLAEGTYEVDFSIRKWNMRSTEYLESIGCLDHYVHAAHSVLLSLNEMDLYAKRNVSACHCSLNNYTMGRPRVLEMMRRGIAMGLGTDGAATRTSLDMFQVVHGAVLGQQAVNGTPYHVDPPVTCEQMLKQAFRGGARAARLEREIGTLEVGKKADIVLVSTSDYDQFPALDPVITLAESSVGRDVHTVVVDGRIVMQNRKLLTMDLEPMRERVAVQYKTIMERFDRAIA